MGFTRKELRDKGFADEQIDTLIDLHTGVTDGLKDRIEELEKNSTSAEDLNKKIKKLEEDLQAANEYKEKYEKADRDLKDFKAQIDGEKKKAAQDKTFSEWVKKLGFSRKGTDMIMEFYKDRPDFDDKGNIVDTDKKIENALKSKFEDYIETESIKGANTPNPPANSGGKTISRAREIANQYHASQWGNETTKGEN